MMSKSGDLVRVIKTSVQDSRFLNKMGVLVNQRGVDDCGNPEVFILVEGNIICVYPDGYEMVEKN